MGASGFRKAGSGAPSQKASVYAARLEPRTLGTKGHLVPLRTGLLRPESTVRL